MRKEERGNQELGTRRVEEPPAPPPRPERPPAQMRLFPEVTAVLRLDPNRLRRIAYL
ncbi:MAG: hypothetical protein HY712_00130 [candidate division NC10 bacterium]|nr:hypothetical protein [candidate division NC10 bacterium]